MRKKLYIVLTYRYLRETRQRRVDGSYLTHLQIAESVWDPVKRHTHIRILYNGGRAEDPAVAERLRRLARSILRRCSPEEIIAEDPAWRVCNAWPYGDIYVLEQLWQRLGMAEVLREVLDPRKLDFPLERALFAMVANRACAPASKLSCHEQWLAEEVRIEGTEGLALHHLYRAMDLLEANKERSEQAIYYRLADLFDLDVELLFYDTTSLHFEIDEEDEGRDETDEVQGSRAAGAKTYRALRKRGKSKNGRDNAPQIVVGIAVTRDGFPVRHWVFPGNTVDVTTVEKIQAELKGWKLERCVFVGDAGMVSEKNLKALGASGGRDILCLPIHPGGEIDEAVLSRPGRYRAVAENLGVKEIVVGEGERRRRYVLCHNPQEEARQREHRARVLTELQAELQSLRDPRCEGHSNRGCGLRASRRYGRYLTLTAKGALVIDEGKVKAAEALGRQVRRAQH